MQLSVLEDGLGQNTILSNLINFLYLGTFYVTKMEDIINKVLNRTYLPLSETWNYNSYYSYTYIIRMRNTYYSSMFGTHNF